jgi:hypothetical protein
VRPIYVQLPDEQTRRALVNVAESEFRDPRAQAAKFIVDGLRRAGALPAEERTIASPILGEQG